MRLLKLHGTLTIAHFDYLTTGDNVAAQTERLLLEHNPAWVMAGSDGLYEHWKPELEDAGFRGIRSFWYDEPVSYSHEAWRGRIRTCNGILAIADPEVRAECDLQLAELLQQNFPDPVQVPHRVFVVAGQR